MQLLIAVAKSLDLNHPEEGRDPHLLGAWIDLVRIHLRQGNVDAVAKCVEHMKAINPLAAKFRLGLLYAELRRFDEAIDWYSQVLAAINNDPQVYVARGDAYEQKGDLRRAGEDFAQVARLVPQSAEVKKKLDSIQGAVGQSVRITRHKRNEFRSTEASVQKFLTGAGWRITIIAVEWAGGKK